MFLGKYLKEILLCFIILLLIGIYAVVGYFYFAKENVEINEIDIPLVQDETVDNKIKHKYVEIKGAVAKPGVFEITDETIVNDIVILAGGFNDNAYTNNINLSKKLNDETVIYVYTKYEYSNLKKENIKEVIIEKECICPEIDISSCEGNGSSLIEGKPNNNLNDESKNDNIPSEETTNKLININTATKEELMTLDGIGDAKADKIILHRTENGMFTKIDDIKLVSGISDALFEKIKDSITV